MKIGIIIYSQTEHTYSVAQKLKEKLIASGHEVNLERLITMGDAPPRTKNIEFKEQPNINMYDALIFGAPVHAFSLAPAMKAYLEQITSLENKKVACFVTKGYLFTGLVVIRQLPIWKKFANLKVELSSEPELLFGEEVAKKKLLIW